MKQGVRFAPMYYNSSFKTTENFGLKQLFITTGAVKIDITTVFTLLKPRAHALSRVLQAKTPVTIYDA
jgi:hypothetical protein